MHSAGKSGWEGIPRGLGGHSARRNKVRSPHRRTLSFEALESRRMLSTISWTNRGSGAPGDDPDGFIALFGSSAGLARQIVDRAIDDWEAVIQNFNFAGGGNTFNLQVVTGNITAIASASITGVLGGKPTSSTITVRNTAATHWLDPTPLDDAEFTNNITNVFTAFAAGISGTDLYATMIHEIGHAVGITQNASVAMSTFTTDTGIDDPNSATAGNLLAFNVGGGPVEATFTASDFGHLWEGPATALSNAAGLPVHADDLMNPGRAINSNERNLISNTNATILQLAYGYTVAMPSTINNMLVNGNFSTNALSVLGGLSNADDTISIAEAPGEMVRVSIGNLQELVPLSEISTIVVNSGGGNDNVRFYPLIPPLFPTPAITAVLGSGSNTLEIVGATNGYDSITLNNTTLTSTGVNIVSFSGAQALTLYTDGGNADVSMPNTPGELTSATIFGGFGSESINLHALDSLTPVTINALGGDDTIVIGASPFASEVILSPVTVNGGDGNDTLFLGSNNGDSIDANVTFNGGASVGGVGDRIVFNDTAPSYNIRYDITPTFVTRDGANLPRTVSYSSTEGIVVNAGSGSDTVTILNAVGPLVTAFGNGGNDNFIVGGGNLNGFFPQDINGGPGTDQITFDDSANPAGKTWDINETFHPNEIIYSGLITLPTTGFESVGILAGLGIDNITFNNDIRQNYSVNGGALNANIFRWNAANNYFRNPDGPDAIYAVDLVLGPPGAFSGLLIEDFSRLETDYYITDSLVQGFDTNTSLDGFEVRYHNANFLTINGSNERNTFQLASAHPDSSYNFFARGGNDRFDLTLDTAVGGQSIRTDGNDGSDSLFITDVAFSGPATYLLNSALTRSSAGGSRYFSINTVESLTVTGTAAADTFTVNSVSTARPMTLNGAGGNDTYNVFGSAFGASAPVSLTLADSAGFDTFNLNDQDLTSVSNAVYQANAAGVVRVGTQIPYTGIDITNINCGAGADLLEVFALSATAGQLRFFGGAGNDALTTATFILNNIAGPITFDGQGGTNNTITLNDTLDSTGDTVHMTASTLGAHPDDNLFGVGGSLEFFNIVDMTLTLGTGPDTVHAQPLADATVQIAGNNPTTAPGDTLNLDLASAVNYVITPTSATAGNVTSDNLQTLTYSGFETGPNIDDVPDVPIFVVDTLVDESDGDYSAGDLSLREAIRFSNFTSEIDSIAFSAELSGGTIVLMLGELRITRSVPIIGLGADLLTIDASGNDTTPLDSEGNGSRVFNIDDGNIFANIDVEIVGLTITGGDVTGSGGGILTREDLSIVSCTIRDNAATTGGGFHSIGGNLTVASSTISGNAASSSGGGIYSQSVSLTVTNSTISGNSANSNGGGISTPYGGVSLAHSTITGNVADADQNNSGMGGGIAVFNNPYYSSVNVELEHVILAGNIRGISTRSDIFGPIAIGGAHFSLIGDNTGASIFNDGSNLIGTSVSPIDPLLGLLADNGGPTMTHALLVGSPAIDAGDPGFTPPPANDQRGVDYVRVYDGDGVSGATIDMGAFELQPLIVLPVLLGDYNQDTFVDAADYTVWSDMQGQSGVTPYSGADGNGDRTIGPEDYDVWKSHFGESLPMGGGGGLAVDGGDESNPPAEPGADGYARVDGRVVESDDQPPAEPAAGLTGRPVPAGVGVWETFFDEWAIGSQSIALNGRALIRPPADPAARYPAGADEFVRAAGYASDAALLAWCALCDTASADRNGDNSSTADRPSDDATDDAFLDHLDAVFELVGSS